MALICLDTQILIWGVQKKSRAGQEIMISKTEAFFKNCESNKTPMMIPSIVVGEFLTPIPVKDHPTILNSLSSSFIIMSYDMKAAAIFAKLWHEKKESGLIDKVRSDDIEIKRQELKADCMIVATAIAAKADVIYSHDKGLKNFAGNSIKVLELPNMPIQEKLNYDL